MHAAQLGAADQPARERRHARHAALDLNIEFTRVLAGLVDEESTRRRAGDDAMLGVRQPAVAPQFSFYDFGAGRQRS